MSSKRPIGSTPNRQHTTAISKYAQKVAHTKAISQIDNKTKRMMDRLKISAVYLAGKGVDVQKLLNEIFLTF